MLLSERLLTNRSLFRVSQNLCPRISCHDFQVRIGQRMWNTLFQLWSRVGQGAFDSDIWSGIRNIFPGNIPGKIFEEWIPLLDAKKTIQNKKFQEARRTLFYHVGRWGPFSYIQTHTYFIVLTFEKFHVWKIEHVFFAQVAGIILEDWIIHPKAV